MNLSLQSQQSPERQITPVNKISSSPQVGGMAKMFNQLVSSATLYAITTGAFAIEPPAVPIQAPTTAAKSEPVAKNAFENMGHDLRIPFAAEGKFAEAAVISMENTPKTPIEIPNTEGASVEVAFGQEAVRMKIHLGEAIKAKIQAGDEHELFIVYYNPDPVNGGLYKHVDYRWEKWDGAKTFPTYYGAVDSTTPTISFAELGEGGTFYFGLGAEGKIRGSADDDVNHRKENRVKNLLQGTYTSVEIGLKNIQSITSPYLAEPNTQVTSDAINLAAQGITSFPATVSGVGANIITTPFNGQPGIPTKTAMVKEDDTIQMAGTTPGEFGAAMLMKAMVKDANGRVQEISWEIHNKEKPTNPAPAPETETPEISITDNPAQAPEAVKMPEITKVNATELSTNPDAPTPLYGALQIVMPAGTTAGDIIRVYYNGESSAFLPYLGKPIQADTLGKEYGFSYTNDAGNVDTFFTLLPQKTPDKQP